MSAENPTVGWISPPNIEYLTLREKQLLICTRQTIRGREIVTQHRDNVIRQTSPSFRTGSSYFRTKHFTFKTIEKKAFWIANPSGVAGCLLGPDDTVGRWDEPSAQRLLRRIKIQVPSHTKPSIPSPIYIIATNTHTHTHSKTMTTMS